MKTTKPDKQITLPTFFKEGFLDTEIGIPKEVRRRNKVFGSVERCIDQSRSLIQRMEKVRKADLQDETLSMTGRKLQTLKYWKSQSADFMSLIGQAEDAAKAEANRIDSEIKNGLRKTSKNSTIALGAWQILREIPQKSERIKYIRNLINQAQDEPDRELVEAILGSNPQLIGVDRDDQNFLLSQFEKKYYADEIEVRDNLKKARQFLNDGYEAATETIQKSLHDPDLEKAEKASEAAKKARIEE